MTKHATLSFESIPASSRRQRLIACLVFPGVMSLDVFGPLQVFASANELLERRGEAPAYRLMLLASGPLQPDTSAHIRIVADCHYRKQSVDAIDTLLIPGGDGIRALNDDTELLSWLKDTAPRVRRLGSICTGARLLAHTGLLDDLPATTHWNSVDYLQENYPCIRLNGDRLHTYDPSGRDGDPHIFTSAGVTAGIDLALALVEADHDRSLALAVARQLVLFFKRPGGQAQFSPLLMPEAKSERLGALLEWIGGHLGEPLTLDVLAQQAFTTPRSLSRYFKQELGTTPGRYIERLRVETARQLLDGGQLDIASVARLTGIGHPASLRRLFSRHLGISPSAYRQRFADS